MMKLSYGLFISSLFVLSCSKHYDNATGPTISGKVQLGPVKGAKVKVHKIKNGKRDEEIGSSDTDDNGNFSVPVPIQDEPVEIVAKGGSYTDEATNSKVTISDDEEIGAIVDNTNSSQSTPITPLTDGVKKRVLTKIRDGIIGMSKLKTAKEAAEDEVGELYGVDRATIRAIPADPKASQNLSSIESKAAFVLATLSQAMKDKNISVENGASPLAVVKSLNDTFAKYGKVDGNADSSIYGLASNWVNAMRNAKTNVKNNSYVPSFKDFDDSQIKDCKAQPEDKITTVVEPSATDVITPTIGNPIFFTSIGETSLTLNWGAATDNSSSASQLSYKLVKATSSSAIDTISEADAINTVSVGLVLDWTANTTSKSVTGLTAGTTYYFAVLVKDAAGNKSLYPPKGRFTGKMIFVTQNPNDSATTFVTFKGSELGGISGADTKCSIHRPIEIDNTSSTKAIIVASSTRRACQIGNCADSSENIDWVLAANTTYYTKYGDRIGATNAAGIFDFQNSSLSRGVNSLGPGYAWTGFAGANWTTSNYNTCESWALPGSGSVGSPGNGSQTLIYASANLGCADSYASLMCAEE